MTWLRHSLVIITLLVAGTVSAEEVVDFSADYEVRADGAVAVTETIVYDFEEESRRGIFRVLKNDHPQSATAWYKRRSIGIDMVAVTQDGEPAPYEITHSNNETQVRIGDAAVTFSGTQTYTLEYVLRGALSYGPDGAELYHNVTGHGWSVPIGAVRATVRVATSDMLGARSACYVGSVGSTDACTDIVTNDAETVFTTNELAPSAGLTIAQSLNPDAVAVLVHEQTTVSWILYPLSLLWLVVFSVWAWRFHHAERVDRPVIAHYEPYAGLLPMYAGVLFDKRLDPHDITAGIVYLAEQGFITIKKTERKTLLVFNTTDYDITLRRPLTEVPTRFLESLSELLFPTSSVVGTTIALSSLASKQTKNARIIQQLNRDLREDLQEQGFLKPVTVGSAGKRAALVLLGWLVPAVGAVVLLQGFDVHVVAATALALLGSALIFFVAVSDRRSAAGHEARNHLEGFKKFLSVTEKERYAFHNAPAKSPELFMQYLPYAIALGVEKEWAEVFVGITIPNPGWYDGGSAGAFSAAALTSDIGAFSTSFTSSSGTGGSSGSGASGGGGGGGGGGSW